MNHLTPAEINILRPILPLLTHPDIGGSWHLSLFFGLLFCLIFIFKNMNQVTIWARALCIYALASALFFIEFPADIYGDNNTAYQATAGQSFVENFVLVLTVLYLTKRESRFIFKWVIPAFVVGEMILLWCGIPALMNAPSFDTALIALCIPFLPGWLIIPAIGTIVTTHGSTALLILGVQILSVAFYEKASRVYAALALPALAYAAWVHHHGPLLDGSERMGKYIQIMTLWGTNWKVMILGAGAGSFQWISFIADRYQFPLFFNLHSDWLQILFEEGIIGFILAVGLLIHILKRSWRKPKLMAGILGGAAFMLTYHPMRYFPSAFVLALIIREAIS